MSKKHANIEIWQYSWSKWIIYLTVFLVPLKTGLSHWYPFTTPKTLLIILGTCLSAAFFFWGYFKNREKIKFTLIHWLLLAFILTMTLGGIFGVDSHTSFFGTFRESVSLSLLYFLFVLFIIISEFIRRDSDFLKNLALSGFISGIVVSLISYLPLLGSKWKILEIGGGSTLGNSSFAGAALLFTLGFGFYIFICANKIWQRVVIGIGGLVVILSPTFFNGDIWKGSVSLGETFKNPLLLSGQAQGALLAFVIAFLLSITLWLVFSKNKIIKIFGAGASIILLLFVGYGYIAYNNPNSNIHQSFAELKSGNRFLFTEISNGALKEKPVLGYGFENYNYVYQQNFDPKVYESGYAYEQWVSNPHNIVSDMKVSAGILGLIAYLVLLFKTIFSLFSRAKLENSERQKRALVVFSAVLIGYFVQNIFIFDTPTSFMFYFLILAIAAGYSAFGYSTRELKVSEAFAWLSSIGLVAAIIIFVILPGAESRAFAKIHGQPLSQAKTPLEVSMISLMGGPDDDALNAMEVLSSSAEKLPTLDLTGREELIKNIENIVSLLDKDAQKHPKHFYVNYSAGQLMHVSFIASGQKNTDFLNRAKAYLEKARDISPKNPKVYFNLAQNAIFRNELDEAITLIKTGIELAPQAGDGYRIIDSILKKYPNKELQKYFDDMKEKWTIRL